VTTLIIHPSSEIQQEKALQLAASLLGTTPQLQVLMQHPDLHLLDGSLVTSIGIDDVRSLLRSLRYHPYQSSFQVGLILLANMLTEEAQNSLLKTLEEPGAETQFILTTPHERFLLPTILSRSNCVYVQTSIVIPDSPETDSKASIKSFLEKDIVDKFLFIEGLLAKEKEQVGAVTDFLRSLTQAYRKKLIMSTEARQIQELNKYRTALKHISRAQQFIKRNTNKRVTLENLILQLEVRIMGCR
jgi:hypothetical protein